MRALLSIVIIVLLVTAITAPVTVGRAGGPTASLTNPGSCSAISYDWNSFRKARTAELRIHHFGIYETTRQLSPVDASGTFVMPADVAFAAGDQYTVLSILLDSAGRPINPSAAVWWGSC